jgi:SAM-dependent methyltransferase
VTADQIVVQAGYHRSLYEALWDWPQAVQAITSSGLQGMDLLGHFGAAGCDLVGEVIVERAPRHPLRLAELGSGIGGVLRHVLSTLDGRVPVELAVGCELVEAHCRLAGRIDRGAAAGPRPRAVCTSVERVALASGGLDVVFASGAVSHFADMAAVLAQARRVLRPGGLLTFTEEVSLLGSGGAPSSEFRAMHPAEVFFTATWQERRGQLDAAGFVDVDMRDLSEWAAALLRRRLLAMRVHRRAVADVYGETQTQQIVDTLSSAREEITSGRLAPAQVIATAGG